MTTNVSKDSTELTSRLDRRWGKKSAGYTSTYDYGYVHIRNRSAIGQDNPNWKSVVARGGNATNSFSAYRTDYYLMDCHCFIRVEASASPGTASDPYVWQDLHSGQFGGVLNPNLWRQIPYVSHSSTAAALAVQRFRDKVDQELSPFKGLTFLGELTDTIKLLKGRGGIINADLSSYIETAKKLLMGSRSRISQLGDLWLEYAFGWRPLFADIKSAVEVLSNLKERHTVVRGTGKDTMSGSAKTESKDLLSLLSSGSAGTIFWSTRDESTSKCIVKGAVKASLIQPVYDPKNLDTWGFRTQEFVPALWELLPYSWIVDYFTNMGAIINGAFFDEKCLAWYFRTQKSEFQRTTVLTFDCRPRLPKGYRLIKYEARPSVNLLVYKKLDRDLPDLNYTPLILRYPSFDSMSWTNLGAFLAQQAQRLEKALAR